MTAPPIAHIERVELPCADRHATAHFYGELFGWHARHDDAREHTGFDAPPGPGGAYISVAEPQARAGEALLYAATDDIAATLGRIEAAGGTTLVPRTEVLGRVWFAFFADPSGNRLGLVEVPEYTPATPPPATPHPIAHLAIPAHDPHPAAAFYNATLGWKTQRDTALGAVGFAPINGISGSFPQIDSKQHRAGQIVIYAATDDVGALLDKAATLGAQVTPPPTTNNAGIQHGRFTDPDGNTIGVLKPSAHP